ncbi:MAG: hypothetical protein WBE80_08810 [Methylocella sp.]
MQSFAKFLASTTISMLASGGAIARTSYYEYGPPPPNPPRGRIAQGRPVQELDGFRYGYSGTRGRMGLGADPAHPEGPGNFSSPGGRVVACANRYFDEFR